MLPSSVDCTVITFVKLSVKAFGLDTIKLPVIVNVSSNLLTEFTSNPLVSWTDAVTLPVAIRIASSESADCGILNNPLASPDSIPSSIFNEPLTFIEPVNSCLSVTLSPNTFEPDE